MAADDFTTLANVKAWLGKTDTTSDAILALLITQISAEIRKFTGRDIYPVNSYAYVTDGNNRTTLTLPQYPVDGVTGVTISGAVIPPSIGSSGGYKYDRNSIRLIGYGFFGGVLNVSINYTAGFDTIPPDIERACIEWVAYQFEGKTRIGYKSKTQGDQTTSFITDDMPDNVKKTLLRWIRVYPS